MILLHALSIESLLSSSSMLVGEEILIISILVDLPVMVVSDM